MKVPQENHIVTVLGVLLFIIALYIAYIDDMRGLSCCYVFPVLLSSYVILLTFATYLRTKRILFLAIMSVFVLPALVQRVFIFNDTLYGYDTIHEFKYFIDLLTYNRLDPFPSNYPSLYTLSASFATLTDLPPSIVARYFPIALAFATNVMIYLLFHTIIRHTLGKHKQLLPYPPLFFAAVFSLVLLYQHVMFHSTLIKETYSFLFFVMTTFVMINLAFGTSRHTASRVLVLSIFSVLAIAMSHHLTSFVFMIFISSLALAYTLIKFILRSRASNRISAIVIYFTVLSLIILFIKWTYYAISYSPIILIKEILKELYSYSQYSSVRLPISSISSLSLRQEFVLIGEIAFAVATAVLFLIMLKLSLGMRSGSGEPGTKSDSLRFLSVMILVYSFAMSLLVILTLRTRSLASTFFIRRIQSFIYPIYIPVLISFIFISRKRAMRTVFVRLLYGLLVFYLIVQVISLQPYLYCRARIDYLHGETRNFLIYPEWNGIFYFLDNVDRFYTGPLISNWYYIVHAIEVYSDWRISATLPNLGEDVCSSSNKGAYAVVVNHAPNLLARRIGDIILNECGPDKGASMLFNNGYVLILRIN